jgi:putative tryptophan/tyrosine transport system substrate-binding protein
MKRRQFFAALGGLVCRPLVARAQQPSLPVVGVLGAASGDEQAPYMTGFVRGLNQAGFIVGRNVAIEYRWAEGDYDRLPALAAELVSKPVAVILASGGPEGAVSETTWTDGRTVKASCCSCRLL